MPPVDLIARADAVRHALLELHKAMIEAQRIVYERGHGRISTPAEFLGLLEHPEFDWIRALSALIAQLDEWSEDPEATGAAGLDDVIAALRSLLQRDGTNAKFSPRYWEMIDSTPDVLVAHVKLTRLLGK